MGRIDYLHRHRRRRETIMVILLALLALAGVVFVLAMGGCGERPLPQTPRVNGFVQTIQHDGHWFVTFGDGSTRGGITHHPDCPKCSERKAVEP